MRATIKTALYAAKLRAAIKEAEATYAQEMAQYTKNYASYKTALATFVTKEVVRRIGKLVPGRKLDRYRSYRDGISPDSLFAGAPQAPAHPSRDRINKLRKRINYVAIAAPESIVIDEDDDLLPPAAPHED